MVFLLNLLVAHPRCAYDAIYADLVGYARLQRIRFITFSMASVTQEQLSVWEGGCITTDWLLCICLSLWVSPRLARCTAQLHIRRFLRGHGGFRTPRVHQDHRSGCYVPLLLGSHRHCCLQQLVSRLTVFLICPLGGLRAPWVSRGFRTSLARGDLVLCIGPSLIWAQQ